MLKIAFSPVYIYSLPPGHRFPMVKYELLPEQLIREGTISESQLFEPKPFDDDAICLTHTAEYVHKLNTLALSDKEVRNIGFPVRKELVTRGKVIASGTYTCALHALQDGIGMNIAGGTHHSFADRGEGFCLFNDVAIASNVLIHHDGIKKILVIDLDVHQGNGTAKIFEKVPEVFTFSMHGEKNYPVRKEKSNLDIGLPDQTEGSRYLTVLKEELPKIIDQVQPEIAFFNAGVDILDTDKLGRLRVSKQDTRERDRFVFSLLKKNGIPVVAVMGGGYSDKLSDILDAHANTFRSAQEIFF